MAREVAVGLLRGAADFYANPANPPGCLMVQGALVGSDAGASARRETSKRRDRLREAIQERLERAIDEGDLPPGAHPKALAFRVLREGLEAKVHRRINVRVLELIDTKSGSRIELEGMRLPITHSKDVIEELT